MAETNEIAENKNFDDFVRRMSYNQLPLKIKFLNNCFTLLIALLRFCMNVCVLLYELNLNLVDLIVLYIFQ